MIAAGTLDIPITIEQAPEMRGSTGQKKLDWANATVFCSRRASFTAKGGRGEFQAAQQAFAERVWIVRCHGRADITTLMRIKTHDGRYMEILDVYSEGGKPPQHAPMITLVCREGPVKAT